MAELSVNHEPFNKENSCFSSANRKGYEITTDENGQNMLTGKKSESFTIVEMEVWQVEGKKWATTNPHDI